MERWRQEQRLAHNSTRGGSLCCMDWRTRKGWVCICLRGFLLALLYNKAVWGYASLQSSHALTVDFWRGDAWDVNKGNKPVAVSFSKNVWFNAWAKKSIHFVMEEIQRSAWHSWGNKLWRQGKQSMIDLKLTISEIIKEAVGSSLRPLPCFVVI